MNRLQSNSRKSLHEGASIYLDSDSKEPEWKLSPNISSELNAAYVTSCQQLESQSMSNTILFKDSDSGAVISSSHPSELKITRWRVTLRPSTSQDCIDVQADIVAFTDLDGSESEGLSLPIVGHNRMLRRLFAYLARCSVRPYSDEKEKLPHQSYGSLLGKKISYTTDDLVKEAGLEWQTQKTGSVQVTESDRLAILHRETGLQIIADHHSKWTSQDPSKD